MNLINEPFLEAVDTTSSRKMVGWSEALLKSHELVDFQFKSPLARVANLRSMLSIVYRACGPTKPEEWLQMWKAGKLPEDKIQAYLRQWEDRFNLFDEKYPFLQIPGLVAGSKPGTLAQLATELATGNTPTLFDHTFDDAPTAFSPAEAAHLLLAAQQFSLGFGKSSNAVVNGQQIERPYLADAIALRGVTIFLSGRTLFETLMLNLVSGKPEDIGTPSWEFDDPLTLLDRVEGKQRIAQKALGAADRYTWQSRMIRLLQEPDGTVRHAYFSQGREADKGMGDPMKVYVQSQQEGIYAQSLNFEKASWRDLHTYLSVGTTQDSSLLSHAAVVVGRAKRERLPGLDSATLLNLNVIGLATDPGKAGKFLLWRHDRMSLPASVIESAELQGIIQMATSDATFVAQSLGERIRSVLYKFLPPEGNPDPADVSKLADSIDPRRAFWARLENHFNEFLRELPVDAEKALTEWREKVEREAYRAFRESCEQLGDSVRAMKARAQVHPTFIADQQRVEQMRQTARNRNQNQRQRRRHE